MRPTLKERFEAKFTRRGPDDCWLWHGSRSNTGHGTFTCNSVSSSAQRASWKIYRGPIPNKMYILHTCDVRNCVNPNHLFIGTQRDNIKDMVKKGRGRQPKGEASKQAKVTEAEVREIRSLVGIMTYRKIGKIYGISNSVVCLIIKRKTWKHIS